MEQISEFIFDVISASSFKEFYLSEIGSAGYAGTDAMVAYLSDYDFRRCKYRTPENKDAYNRYMLSAMSKVISTLMNSDNPVYDNTKTTVIERDAFPRSLCTHAVKCRLKIRYAPLSKDIKLRSIVTMAVRYTENKLRANLGVKSRLAIKDFPDQYKRLIDEYFDSLIGEKSAKVRKENLPEYEALYDAPSEALSISGADKIEQESWVTTARLVGDEYDYDSEEATVDFVDIASQGQYTEPQIEGPIKADNEYYDSEITYGLGNDEISIISDIIEGRIFDFGFETLEKIEKINEAFSEGFGDVIIESDGDGYKIIEDYQEDIKLWLTKIKK
jgi:hypothetical protein